MTRLGNLGIVSPLGGLVASVLPPREGGYDGTLRGVCHPALFSVCYLVVGREVKGLDWIDEPSIRIDDRRIGWRFIFFLPSSPRDLLTRAWIAFSLIGYSYKLRR